jgi:hypothetical protein
MSFEELLALGRAKLDAQAAYNRVQILAAERARFRAMRTAKPYAFGSTSATNGVAEQIRNAYHVIAKIDEQNPGDPATIEALQEVRDYLAVVGLDP